MHDPFSYLVEDDAGAFFQKAATRVATPAARTPATMAKTAAETTPFEKVARRLDRDIEILRSVGMRGANAGMQKRADAYLDQLLTQVDLSPEEFGEVFDKVAAAAIQGDLDAMFVSLCSEVPSDLHPLVETELAKVGQDLVSMAMMEKEALIGAIRGGLGAVKGVARYLGGGAARAVAKPVAGAARAVAKPVAAAGRRVAKSAPVVGTRAREARHLRTINAPDKARAELARVQAATQAGGLRGAAAKGALPAAQKNVAAAQEKARRAIDKRDTTMKKIDEGWDAAPAAPANTTAARAAAPSAPQASQAKVIKAEGEAAKAQGDAADAARVKGKPDLKVMPGGKADNDNLKGTGTDGPAPKPKANEPDAPKAKADADGATPPPPGGAEDKPPGFMDAWKKATGGAGWGGLSAAEKGALIRGGVTGAIVYRAAMGRGAITGGEGVI